MRKNTLIQNLAIGLSTLLLGLSRRVFTTRCSTPNKLSERLFMVCVKVAWDWLRTSRHRSHSSIGSLVS